MPRLSCRTAYLVMAVALIVLPMRQGTLAEAPIPRQASAYLIEAAYPAWRRSTYPVERLPLPLLGRISHAAVWPNADGSLVVPDGFLAPELLAAAHAAGREVVLLVGGATRHQEFSAMTADSASRAAFVENLTTFAIDQGYDGLEIDWEFPWSAQDRDNLTHLVVELRAALLDRGQTPRLTLCVASNPMFGQWIDTERITPLIDYYLVMAFNQHSPGSATSGHSAALYPPAERDGISVDSSIHYWVDQRGVPPEKILLGVAFYGISFDSEELYRPFATFGQAYYHTIVPLIGQGFTRHWDTTCRAPYLTEDDGPLLWSYDDAESIDEKCGYVIGKGLAGVAIWDISGDLPGDGGELLGVIAERLGHSRTMLFLPFTSRPEPGPGATGR